MNEMLKKHLTRLIKDHDKLSAQLKDTTPSGSQRRVAGKVLEQVDATINMLMARAGLEDAGRRNAARTTVGAPPRTRPKRSPIRNLLGTAALVWIGSSALGHWRSHR